MQIYHVSSQKITKQELICKKHENTHTNTEWNISTSSQFNKTPQWLRILGNSGHRSSYTLGNM